MEENRTKFLQQLREGCAPFSAKIVKLYTIMRVSDECVTEYTRWFKYDRD